MLNHIHAQVFIETFLHEYFKKKPNLAKGQSSNDIYITDAVNTLRNEGRGDEFTNFSFVIGANYRQDEEKFADHVVELLMKALNENFDGADVGIDWTDWSGECFKDGEEKIAYGFPECRICVNVY